MARDVRATAKAPATKRRDSNWWGGRRAKSLVMETPRTEAMSWEIMELRGWASGEVRTEKLRMAAAPLGACQPTHRNNDFEC